MIAFELPQFAPASGRAAGLLTGVLACIVLHAAPAAAADASPWDADSKSAIRLIAGQSPHKGEPLRAGIEIKLNSGWKTYWRYPGDSGVPPRFDFSRSENLKAAKLSWPAPHRFTDASGASIGYVEKVIFPLDITAQDASKPVTLRLHLDYAVCEKLCIPASGKAELVLSGGPSAHSEALAAAVASVPLPAKVGDSGAFAIRAAVREKGTDRVVVDVAAPVYVKVDLFAEGPSAEWALPLPKSAPGAPAGTRRFEFTLTGLPPGAKADGAAITLTAVAGGRAIEATTRLD